ncbi:MAG: hypothetical protein B6244_08535 [Candidatus Cloacimonetes bacterium 4572_55]|nr:MAG: hypothetical protein B6244_08535 [Candidatus Cloacimonetes bacterium 4572_55]
MLLKTDMFQQNKSFSLTDLIQPLGQIVDSERADLVYHGWMTLLRQEFKADSCRLFVRNAKGEPIERACINMHDEDNEFSHTILNKVFAKGQPIYFPNAKEEPEFKEKESIQRRDFLSVLAIPLVKEKSEVFGALYLHRYTGGCINIFYKEQLNRIIEVAGRIAPILLKYENAKKLFELDEKTIRKLQNQSSKKYLGQFVGNSQIMQSVYERIRLVSPATSRVCVYGESGVGKELVAKAIHAYSPRKKKPLLAINCPAIPKEITESELFGHERNAFTGATARKIGAFERADQGILFLDEIGDLSIEAQAKILRVIQEGEIRRIGGNRIIKIDVRLVVATNKNLWQETQRRRFREDLYYRLNTIRIDLPPLRERGPADIITLAFYFLNYFCRHNNRKIYGFTRDAIKKMIAYNWPGNVRELSSAVERAVVLHKGDQPISASDTFLGEAEVMGLDSKNRVLPPGSGWNEMIKNIKQKYLHQALANNDWNVEKTAIALKMSKKGVYGLLKNFEEIKTKYNQRKRKKKNV